MNPKVRSVASIVEIFTRLTVPGWPPTDSLGVRWAALDGSLDWTSRLNMDLPPLWKCSRCGRVFANRNQSHFCSRYTLRQHLSGKSWLAIALFQGFAKLVKRCGPVRVVPEKTRIAFQVRMSFAAISLRRDRVVGHVVLARRVENPRFTKIESISPRNHVHSFCFSSEDELDQEVLGWVREAYRVGQQRHLLK